MYITKKEIMTRNSQPMEFLTLEDETDIYECVLFPKVFQEFGDLFQWESLFIIRGIIEKSFGVCIVKIEKEQLITHQGVSPHVWVENISITGEA